MDRLASVTKDYGVNQHVQIQQRGLVGISYNTQESLESSEDSLSERCPAKGGGPYTHQYRRNTSYTQRFKLQKAMFPRQLDVLYLFPLRVIGKTRITSNMNEMIPASHRIILFCQLPLVGQQQHFLESHQEDDLAVNSHHHLPTCTHEIAEQIAGSGVAPQRIDCGLETRGGNSLSSLNEVYLLHYGITTDVIILHSSNDTNASGIRGSRNFPVDPRVSALDIPAKVPPPSRRRSWVRAKFIDDNVTPFSAGTDAIPILRGWPIERFDADLATPGSLD
ncbi:hypothetical protein B0T10DRAFT_465219 [Thelonectria olida]|uniref:Uncharacterized protein n=1 Tax=Thelonectria olida TaxID=1576542 RepID=A0A9P9AM12_9HYPO|nr:hypothetical protein B0T10DRAFT_465219 [Thelonectria olida]